MNLDDFVAACNRMKIRKNNLINDAEHFHAPPSVKKYVCARLVDYDFQLKMGGNHDFYALDRVIEYSARYNHDFYLWAFQRKYLMVKSFLNKKQRDEG